MQISLDATVANETDMVSELGSLIHMDAEVDWHEEHRFLKCESALK